MIRILAVARLAALTAGASLVGGVLAAAACRAWVVGRTRDRVVRTGGDRSPAPAPVAAVLGAGLRPDGRPTALLARRVEAGVALFHEGVVARLIMSGAAEGHLDQPLAMARHAMALGVPEEAIDLDRRGVNTAATCRELVARPGAGPGDAVVLVTQEFHIHRALYLAAKAGLSAVGYASPDEEIRRAALTRARAREVPAAVKAVFVDRF